jgi:hypothetical protein
VALWTNSSSHARVVPPLVAAIDMAVEASYAPLAELGASRLRGPAQDGAGMAPVGGPSTTPARPH